MRIYGLILKLRYMSRNEIAMIVNWNQAKRAGNDFFLLIKLSSDMIRSLSLLVFSQITLKGLQKNITSMPFELLTKHKIVESSIY